ncbi:PKD domain-containing protein [bacterium]|nr:PKD domain-containing protein [bacterium]
MSKAISIIFIFLCSVLGFAQIQNENFFVVAGKDAPVSKGDSFFRNNFLIKIPKNYQGKAFLRVFDADFGGKFDEHFSPSQVSYKLLGKGKIQPKLRSVNEQLKDDKVLIELTLGENKTYDNEWKTLGFFDIFQGEQDNDFSTFQFLADGISGTDVNLYQFFISAEENKNVPIPNIEITSLILTVRPSTNTKLLNQLKFKIPKDANYLKITNFDADLKSIENIYFETHFRSRFVIPKSDNALAKETEVLLFDVEKGTDGALVLTKNESSDENVQFWIFDDKGREIPFLLPTLVAVQNKIPVVKLKITSDSDCFSLNFDASESFDTDGKITNFEWFFHKGLNFKGESKVSYTFPHVGEFPIEIIVSDDSKFVANTTRYAEIVRVSEKPIPKIDCLLETIPNEELIFNASASVSDGPKINFYLWDFGDGTTAKGILTKHAFKKAGTYNVKLTVKSGEMPCNQNSETVNVFVNEPPTAKITAPKIAATNENIVFDGTLSKDFDGKISKFEWNFGDGTNAEGSKTTKSFEKAGKYFVKLKVYDSSNLKNNSGETQTWITVNAQPKALLEGKSVVATDENVSFNASKSYDTDGKITDYFWDFGDGTTKNGKETKHSYKKAGTYNVTLRVTDDSNAANDSDEKTFQVRVNFQPVADAGTNKTVNSSKVEFDGSFSQDKDDEITSYFWDFGDKTTAQGKIISHVYRFSGTYTVKLTVTDASNVKNSKSADEITVFVNSPPIADAGKEQVVSFGEKVFFDGSFSQDVDGKIKSYEWELGNNTKLTGEKVSFDFKKEGTYQVSLKVTDNDGATDIHYTEVTVNAKPIAVFSKVGRIAPNRETFFDASASYDVDGKIIFSEWNFGEVSKQGLKVSHKFESSGRYKVILTIKDNQNVSNNTTVESQTVEVNYAPAISLVKDVFTCLQTVNFDFIESSDADGDNLNFYWDFGDGKNGSGKKQVHFYEKAGIYPVNLTVDDGQGLPNSKTTTTFKVQINSVPIAVAEVKRNVCVGESVIFDASKSSDSDKDLLKYFWDFRDGTTAEGINPVHVFRQAGSFSVRLTVSDNSNLSCNSSFAEILLQVTDAPLAFAGNDVSVCAGNPVTFDGSASKGAGREIKSYEWDFGDGNKGVGAKPINVYKQAGTYKVNLTITVPDEGDCENTSEDELLVTVLSSPVASFELKNQACVNEKLIFEAKENLVKIDEFYWDFGDGTTAAEKVVAHSFTKSGIYKVKLKVKSNTASGCSTSETEKTVLINESPQAKIDFYSLDNQVFEFLVNTEINFSGEKSRDFDGKISRYFWDFGEGTQKEGIFVKQTFSKTGTYEVKLTVADDSKTDCNTSLEKVLVKIKEPINFKIKGSDFGCVGSVLSFEVYGAEGNFQWFFSDGTQASGKQVTKVFSSEGKFQVVVKNENFSASKDVKIIELPKVELPQEIFADVGETVNFRPLFLEKLPLEFEWDLGEGTIFRQKNVDFTYKKVGNYKASLVLKHKELKDCVSQSYGVNVFINPVPEVEIEVEPLEIFSGGARDEAIFSAAVKNPASNFNFEWNFGDGTQASGKVVKHLFSQGGNFKVSLTVRNNFNPKAKKYYFSKNVNVKKR